MVLLCYTPCLYLVLLSIMTDLKKNGILDNEERIDLIHLWLMRGVGRLAAANAVRLVDLTFEAEGEIAGLTLEEYAGWPFATQVTVSKMFVEVGFVKPSEEE
jgi:hypothetical protein